MHEHIIFQLHYFLIFRRFTLFALLWWFGAFLEFEINIHVLNAKLFGFTLVAGYLPKNLVNQTGVLYYALLAVANLLTKLRTNNDSSARSVQFRTPPKLDAKVMADVFLIICTLTLEQAHFAFPINHNRCKNFTTYIFCSLVILALRTEPQWNDYCYIIFFKSL